MSGVQRFTTDPAGTVAAGTDLEVSYSNPARAGEKVTVKLSNEDTPPIVENIEITLDANGEGSTTWEVPASGWAAIDINGVGSPPDSEQLSLVVT